MVKIHTEKFFRNIIKSTRNQIVFTIFRLMWIQTDTVQSVHGKYNLISGCFNKIPEKILCVNSELFCLHGFLQSKTKPREIPSTSIWAAVQIVIYSTFIRHLFTAETLSSHHNGILLQPLIAAIWLGTVLGTMLHV